MSGIVGSRLNNRGSGLVGSLGTDGQVLTSSGAGVGAVYEAAAGGGKVGQAVTAIRADDTSVTASSFTDTNCAVTITPSAADSKILVLMSVPTWMYRGGYDNCRFKGQIVRSISGGAATNLVVGGGGSMGGQFKTTASDDVWGTWLNYTLLDSPSTTSATTFKLQLAVDNTDGTTYVVANANDTASYMTALEVLA